MTVLESTPRRAAAPVAAFLLAFADGSVVAFSDGALVAL